MVIIWQILFAALILLCLILATRKPGVALGLIIVMFGLEQFLQTRDPFFMDRGQTVNIGVGLVMLTAATLFMLGNLRRFRLDPVHIACCCLFGLSILSQFWTIAPREFDKYYATAVPYYALYFLLGPLVLLDRNSVKTGVWTALYVGIPLVFLFVFLVEWEGRGIRMSRPSMVRGQLTWYSPPLALASMAAYIGILCAIITPKSLFWRLVHFATFALAAYVVFRTQSRGQMIAMGFVSLVCYPLANQASRLKGLIATLAGFLILAGALYLVFTNLDIGGVNRWDQDQIVYAIEGRGIMAQNLIKQWWSAGPLAMLIGLGSGAGFVTSGFYVHNLPAEILGELGIAGAVLYLFINIQIGIKSLKILQKLSHYPEIRREVIAFIALFMFSSMLSLKQGALFSWPHLFFFGIVISHLEMHSRRLNPEKEWWKKMFIVAPEQDHRRTPGADLMPSPAINRF